VLRTDSSTALEVTQALAFNEAEHVVLAPLQLYAQ